MRAKFLTTTVFSVIFALLVSPAMCDIITKYWEFSKDIRIFDYSKKAAAIPLDGQVYNSARQDLGDLRVSGPKNEEFPYAIKVQDKYIKEKKLASSIVSKEITKSESVIVVELKEPLKPFNAMTVIPKTNNFSRKITVEGSNDNKNWEIIRKGTVIYSFAYQTMHRYFAQYTNEIYEGYGFGRYSGESLSIRFPKSAFRYVRVTVPHDQDKEPVELNDIRIFSILEIPAQEDIFNSSLIKMQPDAESKSVENIFDFNYRNVPLSRIDINTDQSNFFRRVDIEGSNDMKDWKNLASGVIFSIFVDEEAQRNTEIGIGSARCRYIKVKVFNGDNKPVKIRSVKGYGLKKYLVIMPEKNIQYKLLYGNPAAKEVSYDLGSILKEKTVDIFGTGALSGEVRNINYEPYKESKPWTEDKQYILWVALIIIILGMIFLGSQVIRRMDSHGR